MGELMVWQKGLDKVEGQYPAACLGEMTGEQIRDLVMDWGLTLTFFGGSGRVAVTCGSFGVSMGVNDLLVQKPGGLVHLPGVDWVDPNCTRTRNGRRQITMYEDAPAISAFHYTGACDLTAMLVWANEHFPDEMAGSAYVDVDGMVQRLFNHGGRGDPIRIGDYLMDVALRDGRLVRASSFSLYWEVVS